MSKLKINGNRLWQSIMETAKIGATSQGGLRRLALTDLDRQVRDLFVTWCREAGCVVTVDQMGNIFARRPGTDDSLPPIMTGSHLDTQPTGGRFDGIFGVMAGLEIIRTLNDADAHTTAPIEVVVWTNEEGSRFAPCMIGSGVFAGVFSLTEALACTDNEGRTIGEELARIGYSGDRPATGHRIGVYLEAHIEQGPVLEEEHQTIGVVSGVLGLRWYDVVIRGQASHAGPTPMHLRRDALVGAARLINEVNRIGNAYLPDACATVGELHVHPNSRNVIPGQVRLTVDLRHFRAHLLEFMATDLANFLGELGKNLHLETSIDLVTDLPPTPFSTECIEVIRQEANALGLSNRDIVSGAGQDAVYLSRIAPTGMIFVPCEGGISHNEKENAAPSDLTAGCNVLLRSMVRLADEGLRN